VYTGGGLLLACAVCGLLCERALLAKDIFVKALDLAGTFGVLVLGDPISATSGFGVCIAIGGGLWYAQERKRLDEATRRGGGDGDNAEQKKES